MNINFSSYWSSLNWSLCYFSATSVNNHGILLFCKKSADDFNLLHMAPLLLIHQTAFLICPVCRLCNNGTYLFIQRRDSDSVSNMHQILPFPEKVMLRLNFANHSTGGWRQGTRPRAEIKEGFAEKVTTGWGLSGLEDSPGVGHKVSTDTLATDLMLPAFYYHLLQVMQIKVLKLHCRGLAMDGIYLAN